MFEPKLIEMVAAAAHRQWCERMAAEGWHRARAFQEHLREHDALVDFSELSPEDRFEALDAARSALETLTDELCYPRGPDRPFSVIELRKGLKVMPGRNVEIQGCGPDAIGVIEDWSVDPATGRVRTVMVRWPSGDTIEHESEMGELKRVAPASKG
jgi:hypothetical protein